MLEKQCLKSKDICKVTFYAALELKAAKVALAGDFNEWSKSAADEYVYPIPSSVIIQ